MLGFFLTAGSSLFWRICCLWANKKNIYKFFSNDSIKKFSLWGQNSKIFFDVKNICLTRQCGVIEYFSLILEITVVNQMWSVLDLVNKFFYWPYRISWEPDEFLALRKFFWLWIKSSRHEKKNFRKNQLTAFVKFIWLSCENYTVRKNDSEKVQIYKFGQIIKKYQLS